MESSFFYLLMWLLRLLQISDLWRHILLKRLLGYGTAYRIHISLRRKVAMHLRWGNAILHIVWVHTILHISIVHLHLVILLIHHLLLHLGIENLISILIRLRILMRVHAHIVLRGCFRFHTWFWTLIWLFPHLLLCWNYHIFEHLL